MTNFQEGQFVKGKAKKVAKLQTYVSTDTQKNRYSIVELSVKVWEKDGEYVASCPELDVFCYGVDRTQANDRLKKVILFYAETAGELGYQINPSGILSALDIQEGNTSSPKPSQFIN